MSDLGCRLNTNSDIGHCSPGRQTGQGLADWYLDMGLQGPISEKDQSIWTVGLARSISEKTGESTHRSSAKF